MIAAFHFLRPAWLLAIPAALVLLWIVSRREDLRRRWAGAIAPHLLDRLIVGRRSRWRFRPVHLTVGGIVCAALAAAGPTWERQRPPFVEDKAPLAIAIDLSRTMDATDVSPSRLERVKLKVRDLLALRSGARTAVFAYAGSAHMVLPLTDDPALIQTYVDSLGTAIMPVAGKDTAKALAAVDAGLAREQTPGTILFLTDGVEASAIDRFRDHAGPNEILVLGVGTAEGGPVPTGPDTFLTDKAGRRVFTRLDVDGLQKLHSDAGVPVATISVDDSDVEWVQRRIQTHLEQRQSDAQTRWSDEGWWLTIPLAVFGGFWFRRGWTIRWAAIFAFAVVLGSPAHAQAADWRFADLWMTADQQGRYYFDRGDYVTAADRFADPMWKGVSLYRAGRFEEAFGAFSRVDTPESYFNQGNALAHLGRFPAAAASYREALKRRPDWPDAKKNLALVERLIPPKEDQEETEGTIDKPDQIKFDDKGKKGKKGQVDVGRQTAEMWMRNIQTTPRDLLLRKFALEAHREAGRP